MIGPVTPAERYEANRQLNILDEARAEGLNPARMTDHAAVRHFVLAGNATLTLRSKATRARFTFKIRRPSPDKPHFVSLLMGSDNTSDYQFLGTIFLPGGKFVHGRRSRITQDATSAKAFAWFWEKIQLGKLPDQLEVWHEGRCCRCGRELTVPESIASGIGPECAKKGGM